MWLPLSGFSHCDVYRILSESYKFLLCENRPMCDSTKVLSAKYIYFEFTAETELGYREGQEGESSRGMRKKSGRRSGGRVRLCDCLPLIYTVSQKNRTPMICLNNSNKSNPILMIFGTKYRHIIFFYWHLLFCDKQ